MYFTPGVRVTQRDVLGLEFSSLDATRLGRSEMSYVDFAPPLMRSGFVADDLVVILVPEPEPVSGRWSHGPHPGHCGSPCVRDPSWLNYPGGWGGKSFMWAGSSSPVGPAYAGLRWSDPRLWAEMVCKRFAGAAGDSRYTGSGDRHAAIPT